MRSSFSSRKRKPSKKIYILPLLVVIVLTIAWFWLGNTTQPQIEVDIPNTTLNTNSEFSISVQSRGSGLKSVKITTTQDNSTKLFSEENFTTKQLTWNKTFQVANLAAHDGNISITISAKDISKSWFQKNEKIITLKKNIDITPPNIIIHSNTISIRQGGSACLSFSVDKPLAKIGISVGELFFPAYKQTSGKYICFFACPYYMNKTTYKPFIYAQDLSGNIVQLQFEHTLISKIFKHDIIKITDNFLNNAMPRFQNKYPNITNFYDLFLEVNKNLRASNRQVLKNISTNTSQTILWKDTFSRQPKSAQKAGFADFRSYYYNGTLIDEEYHLGMDLASFTHDKILAANNGIIVFTGKLGIYGNLIVIDHGLGIQSIYAHLSQIKVKVGDAVKKGDIIALSGSTGMALGDHLHFGILIAGLPVNPIEWWDSSWLSTNILNNIQ